MKNVANLFYGEVMLVVGKLLDKLAVDFVPYFLCLQT